MATEDQGGTDQPQNNQVEETIKRLRDRGYKVTEEYSNTGQLSKVSGEYPQRKARWDWLQLLLQVIGAIAITATIIIGLYQFNVQQSASSAAAIQQQETQFKNLLEQERQTTLDTYLDRMSDLFLNANIRAVSKAGDDIRNLARARTLAALLKLDPIRKGILLKFIYDAGIIGRYLPFPFINLAGADLSSANLSNIDLSGADLPIVNLSSATLSGADLSGAYLPKTDLSKANLQKALLCNAQLIGAPGETAILRSTDLSAAHLGAADLIGADLSGANLNGAILSSDDTVCKARLQVKQLKGADLSNAKLNGADLKNADLTGVKLANADLTGVKWGNTICPDGKRINAVGGSCMGHLI